MLLDEIARVSAEVAAASARTEKTRLLAECLRRAGADEHAVAVAYLSGDLPQGSIGVGWAALRDLPPPAEPPPTLELLEVHEAVSRVGSRVGQGIAGDPASRARDAVRACDGP